MFLMVCLHYFGIVHLFQYSHGFALYTLNLLNARIFYFLGYPYCFIQCITYNRFVIAYNLRFVVHHCIEYHSIIISDMIGLSEYIIGTWI